jgi:hypothetical protein
MPYHSRRILFALNEPGYFRLYGSTISELARRGWAVTLLYDKPNKRGPDLAVPPNSADSVTSFGAFPGQVSPAAVMLRTAVDCVRYLEPAFAHAQYLRRRAEKNLPPVLGFLKWIPRLPRPVVSAAIALARSAERHLPVDRRVLEFVRDLRPDVVMVSPVVIIGVSGAQETEILKAAHTLRVPSIVAVASWDHLTSKGLIRTVPDAVMVWNDIQARETEHLHRIPRSRIMVTGAQSFDRWFEAAQPAAIEELRRTLGIGVSQRVLLFVGSSRNMAPGDSEVRFVRRWLAAVRASNRADVRDAFVIVRPHPGNTEPWQNADLSDALAVVYPRRYGSGVLFTDADVETFRHSLLASSAVVGINTTAMIEAAVVRRPVFSVCDPQFAHSQQQTLHFAYLSAERGGFAIVSDSLGEHVRQLESLFTAGEADLGASDRFVARFVRPLGMNTSATMQLCDAIERAAGSLEPGARRRSRWRTSRTRRLPDVDRSPWLSR